jgi:uracil-DNA glycosylase family protein
MSPRTSLARIREEAAACTRCPLYANATQTVFGEGRAGSIMLVGEQPGDQEDRAGRPFVGPAGRLLRELLDEAGIDARQVYVTNAVKHFKWRPRGTRRIHDKPSWSEISACGHWLGLELEAVRPTLVVCLGATAAQSLLGRTARVGQLRGSAVELPGGGQALVTIHPSAVLRAEDRDEMRAGLLADLKLARKLARPQRTKVAKS